MPLPEYRYGKVSGLLPDLTVVSERSESPMVCCGYCSAQMAALTARPGLSTLMKNEAHAMRAAGGRPHNHGNTASELRAGASKALGVTLQDVSIANIPARLRAGFAVTVGIQYAELPDWLKVQTNDFGHAVTLFGWDELDDQAGFFDPLWTQGARGAWVPWSQVVQALWPNKNHSTTVTKISSGGGGDMGIAFNMQRWRTTKDVQVYVDSEFTIPLLTLKAGTTYTMLGVGAKKEPEGGDGRDSTKRAILVTTGALVPGGADANQNTVMWIKGADAGEGITTTAEWDASVWALMGNPEGRYPCPPVPAPGPDCNEQVLQAVMQRDEEWEDALKSGEPWPTQP